MEDLEQREGTPATGDVSDLVELAGALLRSDPRERPTGEDVAMHVGDRSSDRSGASNGSADVFVGRRTELDALHDAFDRTRRGEPAVVVVHGESGIGKTALVKHFLAELEDRSDVVVLATRCHQAEQLPYRAFDGLVDRLAQFMRTDDGTGPLPPDLPALAQVFPVLQPFVDSAAPDRLPADPYEPRRRAFAALKQQLCQIAQNRRITMFIDDLQWADAEDAALLRYLVDPPDPAPVLIVVGHRNDPTVPGRFMNELLDVRPGDPVHTTEIELGPLPNAEARELATEVAASTASVPLDAIVRQAGGLPLFVQRLAAHQHRPTDDLDTLLRRDIQGASSDARELLAVVGVAGQPISLRVVRDAARLEGPMRAALHELRVGRLLRDLGTGSDAELETYHDRIRETVLATLDAEALQARHTALATAFEANLPDPERLARHWHAAGQSTVAAIQAERAGDAAIERRQARRAVQWFERALAWDPAAERTSEVRGKLADALAHAGRNADAAQQYAQAAIEAEDPERAFQQECNAGMNFLLSGRTHKGLRSVERTLATVGEKMPRNRTWCSLATLLLYSAIPLRGLRPPGRPPSRVDRKELARIDAYDAAGAGLATSDPALSALFGAKAAWLALGVAGPERAWHSLLNLSTLLSLSAERHATHAARALDETQKLARTFGDSFRRAATDAVAAFQQIMGFGWRSGRSQMEPALNDLRRCSTNFAYDSSVHFPPLFAACWALGDFIGLTRTAEAHLKETIETGDIRGQALASVFLALWDLSADHPLGAHARLAKVRAETEPEIYTFPDAMGLVVRCHVALYDGTHVAQWARVRAAWPALRASMNLEIAVFRFLAWHARGLVAAASASVDRAALRDARRAARRLRRERRPTNQAAAASIEASVLAVRGRSGTDAKLEEAAQAFEAADMPLHVLCARRARAGRRGENTAELDAAIRGHGVVDPVRWTATLFPLPELVVREPAADQPGPDRTVVE